MSNDGVFGGVMGRAPHDGQTDPRRRNVGSDRALVARSCPSTVPFPWADADLEPPSSDRDPVRSSDGNSLGDAAAGDGVRFWGKLLAAVGRMAASWPLGADPRRTARKAPVRGCNRLGAGHCGQFLSSGNARGKNTGPSPVDRRKAGSKHHVLSDAQGIPLSVTVTGANRHDVTQLIPLLDAIPPVRGLVGRPRRRPHCVQGDRGYDSQGHRIKLRLRGIRPILAKRRTEHGSGLGTTRWVIERTIAWLHNFRRLKLRYEKRPELHRAFLLLAASCICFNFLKAGSF